MAAARRQAPTVFMDPGFRRGDGRGMRTVMRPALVPVIPAKAGIHEHLLHRPATAHTGAVPLDRHCRYWLYDTLRQSGVTASRG
jgi:hypothetical protein